MNSIGSVATSARPMSHGTRRRRLAMLLLVAGIAVGLLRSGHGGLGVPLDSFADLRVWLDHSEPPVLAAALLRVLGLAGCAYLGCVLSLALIADLVRSRGLAGLSLRLTPPLLRCCLVGSVSSLGVAIGSTVVSLPVGASSPPNPTRLSEGQVDESERTAVMVRLDDAADMADPGVDAPEATMTKLDRSPSAPANPATTQATTTPPVTAVASTARPQASETAAARQFKVDSTWVVMPGDSFWSIAEEVLAEAGDQPSEHAIAAYWQRLIATNRDGLAQPDNPDLLFPAQELIVPEP